jgi:L-gulonate 5-dehydrogenase
MKAMVTAAERRMDLRETPEPGIPKAGEALIRIESVGLCGSDYGLYAGEHYLANYPAIQGHEFAGIVERIGEGYSGSAAVGDRVVVEPLIACGECYPCRRGSYNCCVDLRIIGVHTPGALEEKLLVPAGLMYPVGDLDADLAALVEPVAVAIQGLKRAKVEPGECLLIVGAGPIGQSLALAAVDRAVRVMISDIVPERIAVARQNGVERALETRDLAQLAHEVAEWTSGNGAAVVADATGVPAVIRAAVDMVAASGRLLLVGTSREDVSITVGSLIRKELTLVATRNSAGIFGAAVEVVRRNRERVGRLITHTYMLEQTSEAIEYAMEHPERVIKAVVRVAEPVSDC